MLRQRLKGPSVAAYYPRRTVSFKDLGQAYPDMETWNEEEEDRLEKIEAAKARGKGAPKKKRTAEGAYQACSARLLRSADIDPVESKKYQKRKKVTAAPAAVKF